MRFDAAKVILFFEKCKENGYIFSITNRKSAKVWGVRPAWCKKSPKMHRFVPAGAQLSAEGTTDRSKTIYRYL
jgi:hypothetical protein